MATSLTHHKKSRALRLLFFLRRRSARLNHLFQQPMSHPSDGLVLGDGKVRDQIGMSEMRGHGIAMMIYRPLELGHVRMSRPHELGLQMLPIFGERNVHVESIRSRLYQVAQCSYGLVHVIRRVLANDRPRANQDVSFPRPLHSLSLSLSFCETYHILRSTITTSKSVCNDTNMSTKRTEGPRTDGPQTSNSLKQKIEDEWLRESLPPRFRKSVVFLSLSSYIQGQRGLGVGTCGMEEDGC